MANPYPREPLVPATRVTAEANLAMLRANAVSKRRDLTPDHFTAALLIAMQLERVVAHHSKRPTTL